MTHTEHPLRSAVLAVLGTLAVIAALSSFRCLGAARAETTQTQGSR